MLISEVDINTENLIGKTPLRVYIKISNIESALLLLNRGVRINSYIKDSITLLIIAVFYNRYKVLRLLIRRGALKDIQVKFTTTAFKIIA